ncbi:MAG: YMGG-like glycine zipper-containing protein [Ferruginibacter sp.]
MKKILPILFIVAAFTACQSGPKKDIEVKKDFVLVDTTKIYPNSASSDTGLVTRNVVVAPPVVALPPPVVNKRPAQRTSTTTTRPSVKTNSPVNTNTTLPTPAGSTTTTTSGTAKADTVAKAAPVVKKKEGWSDAAKGATIGGVGGAAAGAVIGRNGKGAVIGGIIGAAGGYILGRKKDKQSGRVDTIKH